MIDPEKFYKNEDNASPERKKFIWRKIYSGIETENFFKGIESRSYILGAATAVIVLLAAIGLFSIVNQISEKHEPEIVKLNETYSVTLAKLERLTDNVKSYSHETNIDEILIAKKDNLKGIDQEITELNKGNGNDDLSYLKQLHLLELYRIKLKLIEDIIIMGEK